MESCLNIKSGTECLSDGELINSAINLWKNSHFPVLFEISECSRSHWLTSQKQVLANIIELPIPVDIINRLNKFVEIIGLEIFLFMNYIKWILRERHYLGYTPMILELIFSKISCTEKGIIDRTETLQLFLVDESISPLFRFVIAAFFCFQDYLSIAWDQMPDNEKGMLSTVCVSNSPQHPFADLLTHCYTFKVKKETDLFGFGSESRSSEELLRFHRQQSVINFNLQAFEFCFNKSAIEEKVDILIYSFYTMTSRYGDLDDIDEDSIDRYSHANKVLLFLYKHLNQEILEFLKTERFDFYRILFSLLRWPYQEELISAIEYLKNFMSANDYSSIIEMLGDRIENGKNDFDYVPTLSEVCEIAFQLKIVLESDVISNAMITLINHTNELGISLITNYMTLTEREELINDINCIQKCVTFNSALELEYLTKLINICLPTVGKVKLYQLNCISYVNKNNEAFDICNVSCIEDLEFFQCLEDLISQDEEKVNVSENMEMDI